MAKRPSRTSSPAPRTAKPRAGARADAPAPPRNTARGNVRGNARGSSVPGSSTRANSARGSNRPDFRAPHTRTTSRAPFIPDDMRSDVRPEMRPDMRSDTRPSRQERYQKEQFEPQRGNVIRRGGNTPPPRQTRANLSAQNTKGISPSGNPPVVAASAPRQPESLSAIFSPNIPPSLAALEQEYLYLSDAVAGTDVLRTSREEQALMRFVGSDALTGKIPVVVAKDSPLIVPAKERLESSMEAHSAGSSEENADGKPAPRPLRRPQQDEPEDARSPFGDIIATMQEVLIARNSGRYIPLPKATERPRPPGVELHPAIGFKLYAPNPHRPQHPQQSSKNKHHRHNKSRPEKVYPAAVPLHDVFATMPPATADFHERLQKTLHYEAELPEGAELLVAVSGGVDSIALLDMLVCLSKKQGYYVAVVHFNHRLRGQESEYDANFVRETCKRYDIPCYIAWADVGRFAEVQSMSLEQAGRELRYKFLEFVAYKRRSDAVLTAHTLNDSVETMLMNMLRGSGLTGLSGIPFQRVFGEHTKVVRPALNMKKAELQEYAALRGLSWREDETNSQTVFRRNKIRNELVPLLEREYSSGVVDVLHRTSQIIMGADDLVRETVERVLPSLVVEEELQPFIGLNISVLRVHKRFLQTELVRRTVQRRFGLALSFEAVDRVLALMDADVGAKADITKGFMAVRDRNQILLGSAPAVHNLNVRVEKNNHYDFGGWRIFLEEIDRKNVKFTADPAVEFIETRILPYRMTLRTWQPGDVFTPLGMKGTMKVSDYLTNSKISFFNRQNVLVLTAAMPEGEQIVWLCGLRLSEQFRLQTDAPKALRLEFRRPKGIVLAPPPQEKG